MKKLVTLGLVAVMTVGSTLTVFAADITTPAEKETEGTATINHVEKNVYKIALPTDTVLRGALTYVADPQGLIEETEGAEFNLPDGVELGEAKGVYFKNYDENGDLSGVSGTSESFIITNKSSRGVELAIEAKLTEEASGQYAGGYSSTVDFSGSGDDVKGLYIGVQGTNDSKATALTATKADIDNVAFTAGDKYEVTYDSTYKYDLIDNASGFPTYGFKITGALNGDVADTVWGTYSGDPATYTAKVMPKINIKFTPSLITAKEAKVVEVDGDGAIWIQKVDAADDNGGFGDTKPTDVTINGKDVDDASISANADGFINITWDNLCEAYGYDPAVEEEAAEAGEKVWPLAKTIQFTVGTVDYCVDAPASLFQ